MSNINLIPLRRRDAKRRRRHIRWCAVGCCAYALAATAAGAAAIYTWGGEDLVVADQLAHVEQDIQRNEHAAAAARTNLAATQLVLESTRQIVERPDWSQLLALLAGESNQQVMLRSCQLRPKLSRMGDAAPGFLVTAVGITRSPSDAQEYAVRLQGTGMFDRVTLLDTRREPFLAMEASTFRLECELGTGSSQAQDTGKDKR